MAGKNIKFLENSPVKLNFTQKLMTPYGGFALLAKLFEKLELKEHLEQIFPVVESSPNGTGIYAKVLRFGLTVLAGGKRFSHGLFLAGSEPVQAALFGVKRLPGSSSALTRFFGRLGSWQKSAALAEGLWQYQFERVIPWQKVGEDYLTFDTTVVVRYGQQEGARKGPNPKKKGRPSHHPILAFLNRSGYLVNLWNRSGNTGSGNGCVEFAKETMARLGDRVKLQGCLADSGFYRIELIQYLEGRALEYVIAAPLSQVLQRAIYLITDWQKVDEGIEVAEFQFQHQDAKWERSRRYVVVRQREVAGENPPAGRQLSLYKEDAEWRPYRLGAYVTSSPKTPEQIWRTYRLRAADENVVKESKQDFGLEGFCLETFYGTEAAMLVRALFYNLITLFRQQVLPQRESRHTLQTLRLKYFVIAAVFGQDGDSPVLRLGVSRRNLRQKILWILKRLDAVGDNRIAVEPQAL